MEVHILTPEKAVFKGSVGYLSTKAANGDIGILPNHAPFVSVLPGSVYVFVRDPKGKESHFIVHNGFIEVIPKLVSILADAAENVEDIDVDRALKAKQRASVYVEKKYGDMARAQASLARAMKRLQMAKQNKVLSGK